MAAGCNSANITTNSLAWHYGYDDAGHQTLATPPVNTDATALAATDATYDMDGAGRLRQTVQSPRTTTYTYDDLGRTTAVSVTTGTATLTTTSTLDGAGRTVGIATDGTSSDTLSQSYDALDRMIGLSRIDDQRAARHHRLHLLRRRHGGHSDRLRPGRRLSLQHLLLHGARPAREREPAR